MLKLTHVYSDVFSLLLLPGFGGIVEQWLDADVGRSFWGWVNVCNGGSLIFSSSQSSGNVCNTCRFLALCSLKSWENFDAGLVRCVP